MPCRLSHMRLTLQIQLGCHLLLRYVCGILCMVLHANGQALRRVCLPSGEGYQSTRPIDPRPREVRVCHSLRRPPCGLGDFWEDTIVKRASWQWEDEELISYIFEGGFLTGVCTYLRMCGCTALTLPEL